MKNIEICDITVENCRFDFSGEKYEVDISEKFLTPGTHFDTTIQRISPTCLEIFVQKEQVSVGPAYEGVRSRNFTAYKI